MTDKCGSVLSEAGRHVAVARGPMVYDAAPPFSPSSVFPEYPFKDVAGAAPVRPNGVYDAVRRSMQLLGLDAEHADTPEWNPLGGIVAPGDTVVLKPNFVREFRDTQTGHDDCLVTHGSIIRAVADYVYLALRGRGRIIVADASHNDADFNAVCDIAGIVPVREFYRRHATLPFDVIDLRPEAATKVDGVIVGHHPLAGDPAGYARINLGRRSMFADIEDKCHLLYGSEYDTSELQRHQCGGVHEYLIARTVLDADCVISLPKLKTHKKTGLTVNMKNLVGINGNKNWLPHHREGTPAQGGDQFADDAPINRVERGALMSFKRLFPLLGPLRPWLAGPIKAVGKRVFGDTAVNRVRSGNWYGNDTTWRMVIDLNRILMYATPDGEGGRLHDRPMRKLFSFVDAIVVGEGNGPMDPTARAAGLILAGAHPVAVDFVCARLMDFDHLRLPVLLRTLDAHELPLTTWEREDLLVHSDVAAYDRALARFEGRMLALRPHFGWIGHVELNDGAERRREAGVVA